MKNKKVILGSLAVLAIGVSAFIIFKKKNNENKFPEGTIPTKEVLAKYPELLNYSSKNNEDAGSEPKKTTLDVNKTLKRGVKGTEVKVLQKSLGLSEIDGDFGENTELALWTKLRLNEITLSNLDKFLPKSKYVVLIYNRGKKLQQVSAVYNFDFGYLKAWGDAILAEQKTFDYGLFFTKKYSTEDGKALSATYVG